MLTKDPSTTTDAAASAPVAAKAKAKSKSKKVKANKEQKPVKKVGRRPKASKPVKREATSGDLRAALKAKIGDLSLAKAADAIGVNVLGLKKVLAGKSKPNARTAKRYAKYLGIDVASLVPATTSPKTRKAKPAVSVKPARRGRPPGRRMGGKAAPITGSLTKALEVVRAALEAGPSDPIVNDQLAREVHEAPEKIRAIVNAIMAMA